jgi:hypothetical protein
MDARFVNPSLLVPPMRRDAHYRAAEALNAQTSLLPVDKVVIYDFDHVDASALPSLAQQFNCYGDLGWELCNGDQAAQREYLKNVVEIKRLKGTPHSIREIFRLLGLGEVVIHEGRGGKAYDGAWSYDGFPVYDGRWRDWAVYRVTVSAMLTTRMAARIRALLLKWAPARDHIWDIRSTDGLLIYNAFANYDGAYNYGAY